jgi:hypothetical protein
MPASSSPHSRQRNAIDAARWQWNLRRPVCSAKIVNESRRSTARLNQRPNCRTVSIQRRHLRHNRGHLAVSCNYGEQVGVNVRIVAIQ